MSGSLSEKGKATLDDIAATQYKGGEFFAPLQFKGPHDEPGDVTKPLLFHGFANTGRPDLGDDIVEPGAFNHATLAEFLKFGRQLFFMHSRYEQVGEITAAKVVKAGARSMFGVTDGGLMVEGFIDSPVDEETGMIPDHAGAKVIHFVRMQVRRNRLKLLSIGWRPTKTETVRRPDPRRAGAVRAFRLVKSLILGEISLVTMAMSPQAMIEADGLKKSFSEVYGDDVADALFCDGNTIDDCCEVIPENLKGFNEANIRRIVAETMATVAADEMKKRTVDETRQADDSSRFNLVSLDAKAADGPSYRVVKL